MLDTDAKGIHQLLLSPLFLFNQILATFIPGTLLLLLLGLKGNATICGAWLHSPFGYKTKVATFLLLAYVLGSALKLPLILISSFHKETTTEIHPILRGQSPEFQKMVGAVITDGVVLSTPGLIDRLSLSQADVGFHIVVGTAFLVTATVHGDGSLRWLEALLGTGMFWVGILKGKKHKDETANVVAIGMANLLARMTPQQAKILSAVINSLKPPDAVPNLVIEAPPVGPEKVT